MQLMAVVIAAWILVCHNGGLVYVGVSFRCQLFATLEVDCEA
jgi:hypothetical protein